MDKIFRFLFVLINLHKIFHLICADEHLQQKFTSKCDDLCIDQSENGTKELGKLECLRGCQYFNIEFLVNARNKDKVVDLNQLVERCGTTCSEAYSDDKVKKEHCFRGCNEMMTLQAKAPLINGWLVYMGATDRNLVLLQPDFDIPSKEDWVLLNSMFRNDYDYDSQYGNYDKISTQIETVPRYMGHEHFTINYCIPVWMWMLPIFLLVAFLYIHYSNYIYGIFLNESLQQEFRHVNSNQLNAAGVAINVADAEEKKCLRPPQEFAVGTDFYFYPAPVVPPPKYNDIVESILMDSSDEEDDGPSQGTSNQKQNHRSVITAKNNADSKSTNNSVVDI